MMGRRSNRLSRRWQAAVVVAAGVFVATVGWIYQDMQASGHPPLVAASAGQAPAVRPDARRPEGLGLEAEHPATDRLARVVPAAAPTVAGPSAYQFSVGAETLTSGISGFDADHGTTVFPPLRLAD